jgi:AbrB family looped-hinge helix DNA binding protein
MEATVTSKGQITIPIDIRKRLGLKRASKVFFVIEGFEVKVMSQMRYALYQAQQGFSGASKEYGYKNEQDLLDDLRKNKEDI